jgi:hypothetical protein
VDVDYFVELTNRVPYNTGSLTEQQAQELKKFGGTIQEMKKDAPLSGKSPEFVPICSCEHLTQ